VPERLGFPANIHVDFNFAFTCSSEACGVVITFRARHSMINCRPGVELSGKIVI